MDACNEKRSHLQKSDGVKTQKELEDTEGFDWLESTELAINKRKNLLNRLIRKAGPFHKIKTRSRLRWIREPLLDTMRYWLVYPHKKVTLFFVTCQKHAMLAPRLFTFCQCRLVRKITDQLSCILFHIRVCIVRDPLYVPFSFWSGGKHKAPFF